MVSTYVYIRCYTVDKSAKITHDRSYSKDSGHYERYEFLHYLRVSAIYVSECIFKYYSECVAFRMALGNRVIGGFGDIM